MAIPTKVEDRLLVLERLFETHNVMDHDSSYSVETLLDATVVLYDECCTSSFKKEKIVSEFVAGAKSVTEHIRKLRLSMRPSSVSGRWHLERYSVERSGGEDEGHGEGLCSQDPQQVGDAQETSGIQLFMCSTSARVVHVHRGVQPFGFEEENPQTWNLPLHTWKLASQISIKVCCYHLAIACKKEYISKYSINLILQPLVEDLRKLLS